MIVVLDPAAGEMRPSSRSGSTTSGAIGGVVDMSDELGNRVMYGVPQKREIIVFLFSENHMMFCININVVMLFMCRVSRTDSHLALILNLRKYR